MISRGEPSLGTLLKELADETRLLFRQEVELAKTEVSEKVSRAVRNAIFIAAGGVIAYAGFLVLVGAAAVGLRELLDVWGMESAVAAWVAPLIVGAVLALVGSGLIIRGIRALRRESLAPRQTIDSLRENTEWVKNRIT